jgi:hypothetical protein
MGYIVTFFSNIHLPSVDHFTIITIRFAFDDLNQKHNRCKYKKLIKKCVLKTLIKQFLKD